MIAAYLHLEIFGEHEFTLIQTCIIKPPLRTPLDSGHGVLHYVYNFLERGETYKKMKTKIRDVWNN